MARQMARSPNRLARDEASALVSEEWAPHEVQMYRSCEVEPGSPPRWETSLLSYPDLGPSDSAYALANKNRPQTAPTRDPVSELQLINERLAADDYGDLPTEGDGWRLPTDAPAPLQRLFARSETRTPLIVPCSLMGCSQAEVVSTIQHLGRGRVDSASVLDLTAEVAKGSDISEVAEQAVSHAFNEGLWLIVTQSAVRRPFGQGDRACGELSHFPAYRRIALSMMTVSPDGCGPSGLFRLWVVVPEPVNLDDTNFPAFPALFVQNALQLKTSEVENCKVVRRLPADPVLLESEVAHRERRRMQGREVDAETLEGETVENQCGERKITGPIFVRSQEMFHHISPGRVRDRIEFSKELGSTVTD